MVSDREQQKKSYGDESSTARWTRRLIISLTVLIWIVFVALFLWLIGHVIRIVILFAIGALLAYAIYPVVRFLQRVIPRWLAIAIVYIVILSGVGAFLYFIALTAVHQIALLTRYVRVLLQPGDGQLTPLITFLNGLGISTAQIRMIGQQLSTQLEGVVRGIAPFLRSIIDIILDILVIAILSIYLLIEGTRMTRWMRNNSPENLRGRVHFLLDLTESIVGGYIRGELLLATIIGLLVGGGMQLFDVPFALLLGVLAFLFEFVPILGTIVTGAISVLLALTHGWVITLFVLVYFLFVHAIEAYIIGPRILGRSVKIHPIVALCAVIAGGELYGVLGIIFSSPLAGLLQAVIITLWSDWRNAYPEQFPVKKDEPPTHPSEEKL